MSNLKKSMNPESPRSPTLMRRSDSLKLSCELSADEVAEALEKWNAMFSIAYPGEGYYESTPDLDMSDGSVFRTFHLYADTEFWDAYCGITLEPSDHLEEIVIRPPSMAA